MKKEYCLYTFEQVKESGLLSNERLSEIESLIKERFTDVYSESGVKYKNLKTYWKLENGVKVHYILQENRESFSGFYWREIMNDILTDEEIKLINAQAFQKSNKKKEDECFAKAEKVTAWDSWVYYDGEYFSCVDDFIEYHLDNSEGEKPAYVWATKEIRLVPNIRATDVLERFMEENDLEDTSTNYLIGVDKLQAALDLFAEENKNATAYFPDYKIAVLLTEKDYEGRG